MALLLDAAAQEEVAVMVVVVGVVMVAATVVVGEEVILVRADVVAAVVTMIAMVGITSTAMDTAVVVVITAFKLTSKISLCLPLSEMPHNLPLSLNSWSIIRAKNHLLSVSLLPLVITDNAEATFAVLRSR